MYLYGASGHAKVILEILEKNGKRIKGIFDDNKFITSIFEYSVTAYPGEFDPLSKETEKSIEGDNDIICAGFQQDVRPFLQLSHVLAFPSYREGFPNVPMQAGCFHLPSIVTNINGCNEIIEHGKNGLIIPVKNANALQAAMELMLTDEKAYAIMKSNAREMIHSRYDQQHFWSLLLNEYSEQLKQHSFVS